MVGEKKARLLHSTALGTSMEGECERVKRGTLHPSHMTDCELAISSDAIAPFRRWRFPQSHVALAT